MNCYDRAGARSGKKAEHGHCWPEHAKPRQVRMKVQTMGGEVVTPVYLCERHRKMAQERGVLVTGLTRVK